MNKDGLVLVATSPTFFNIVLKVLINSGSQETEMRYLKIGKSRCKSIIIFRGYDYIIGKLKNINWKTITCF